MYRRNGQRLPEPQEGAAYFDAFADVVPPRTMGLHSGMLTQGFVPIPGYGGLGDEAPPTEKEYWSTYGMFVAAALITFALSKGKLK
jgi:hypothetical protein